MVCGRLTEMSRDGEPEDVEKALMVEQPAQTEQPARGDPVEQVQAGSLHHVELWVPDLARAGREWGWLLAELGWRPDQEWPAGRGWRLGGTYLVIEQSTALTADVHDRCRPGLNHLAFHARDTGQVDALTEQAPAHGWTVMFPDRYPHAGGPQQYAGYLHNTDGYEVELVAP